MVSVRDLVSKPTSVPKVARMRNCHLTLPCSGRAEQVPSQRYRFPRVPVVLALVLGPSLDMNFRRAFVESRRDPAVFVLSRVLNGRR